MSRFYIFAGGRTTLRTVRKVMADYDGKYKIIAADAGLNALHKLGIKPDILLGDFDSVDDEILDLYTGDKSIFLEQFPSHKDYTDMELAMDLALREYADDIVIFGATGTRMDHVLGSIGSLHTALKTGVRARIVDANNVIEMIGPGRYELKKSEMFGKYVSLLPYTKKVSGVTLKGFVYNLDDAKLKRGSSLGVSNEIEKDEASIEFSDGILIFIQSKD